ncbi:hypothetical protein ACFSSF_07710 [Dietzia aerolata]|uniref:hypothetical protein n=1 Tax=Dietzia aerolata TaxID=595984 RepID=UPI003639B770
MPTTRSMIRSSTTASARCCTRATRFAGLNPCTTTTNTVAPVIIPADNAVSLDVTFTPRARVSAVEP